jgi:hypothetical protein
MKPPRPVRDCASRPSPSPASPTKTSAITDATEIESLRELVAEAYANRQRGGKFDEAREEVASDLGLSSDRVKRYLSREVYSVHPEEADRIRARMVTHLHQMAQWWGVRAANAIQRHRAYRRDIAQFSPEPWDERP